MVDRMNLPQAGARGAATCILYYTAADAPCRYCAVIPQVAPVVAARRCRATPIGTA